MSNSQIHQCDIFFDINVIENIKEENSTLIREDITFPLIICLNQECDLVQNFNEPENYKLLHLLIAPVFLFDSFLTGNHWGNIMPPSVGLKEKDTKGRLITQNEIPRFHYLEFLESEKLPRLIIDFKHFFTINRNYLYEKVDKYRLCSLDNLFKEKISQRFSYFLSRIGLPEV